MFRIQIIGEDVVVRHVIVTCFGGKYDKGDDGKTESGVMNDGSNPTLLGCALPIRSTEASTDGSPLAVSFLPHLPWGHPVFFWGGIISEEDPLEVETIDNGPNVLKYPTHGADLTPYAASLFAPVLKAEEIANEFEQILNLRIPGGIHFINPKHLGG